MALVVAGLLTACSEDGPDRVGQRGGNGGTGSGGTFGGDIPDIVEGVQPSVVAVVSDRSEGSGVIYDEDGVIVTNHHVVERASELEVVFADGSRSPAEVVADQPAVRPGGRARRRA